LLGCNLAVAMLCVLFTRLGKGGKAPKVLGTPKGSNSWMVFDMDKTHMKMEKILLKWIIHEMIWIDLGV